MKQLILAVGFMLTTSMLSAQFQLGLRGSSPSISTNEVSKQFYNIDRTGAFELTYLSTRTSYSYGLGFYKDVGPAWIGADLMYRTKTVQYQIEDAILSERSATSYEDEFKEVTLPIAAGWRKNNFKIGLGPVFTLRAQREYSLTTMPEFSISERNIDTGFQFLIGYVIKDRIHIDLKRELNFNQSGQDYHCLLYTSPSPRDQRGSRMPSSA